MLACVSAMMKYSSFSQRSNPAWENGTVELVSLNHFRGLEYFVWY